MTERSSEIARAAQEHRQGEGHRREETPPLNHRQHQGHELPETVDVGSAQLEGSRFRLWEGEGRRDAQGHHFATGGEKLEEDGRHHRARGLTCQARGAQHAAGRAGAGAGRRQQHHAVIGRLENPEPRAA